MSAHEWMKVDDVADVISVIKTARNERHISYGDLGLVTGLSKGYIHQVEHRSRGGVEPSLTTCLKLLEAMGFEMHIVRKDAGNATAGDGDADGGTSE